MTLWKKHMHTLSSDTHPEIERLHIDLIRKIPVSRRLQMVTSLVKTTRQLPWHGTCERYHNETLETRIERFLFLLYKDSIMAQKVANLLALKKVQIEK